MRQNLLSAASGVMDLKIPGYKILRVVGRGGMATVYLAEQDMLEREVALKVMSRHLAEDPAFGQRFLREAKIVSRLLHPHIVTVHDVGVHNGAYFLAMEYVDGPDLKQAADELSLVEMIRIVKEIASALHYASNKGYVHRDIKPENIMLSAADKRAVLTDFGIARMAEGDIQVTQTGIAVGTPHYMSPEQARGQPVDGRTDLYSLGVVFYYLLTGSVPYQGDSAVAIGIKHITEAIPRLPAELADLQPILDKLLAKTPAERYQNAAQLIDALNRIDPQELGHVEQPPQNRRAASGSGYDPTPVTGAGHKPAPTVSPKGDPTQPRLAAIRDEDLDIWEGDDDLPARPQSKSNWGKGVFVVALLLVAAAVGWVMLSNETAFTQLRNAGVVQGAADDDTESRATREPNAGFSAQAVIEPLSRFGQHLLALGQSQLPAPRAERTFAEEVAHQRNQLKRNPRDVELRQALLDATKRELWSINRQIDHARFQQARRKFSQLGALVPEFAREEQQAVAERLKRSGEITALLKEGQDLLAQGRTLVPEDDNAYGRFRQVLALDSNIEAAREGLRLIKTGLLSSAHRQFLVGDWEDAQTSVEQVLQLDPSYEDALALRDRLQAFSQSNTATRTLISKAHQQLQREHLFTPKNFSAYDLFQQAMSEPLTAEQAQHGLHEVRQAFQHKIEAMLGQQRHDQALKEVDQALANAADDEAMLSALQQLKARLEEQRPEA